MFDNILKKINLFHYSLNTYIINWFVVGACAGIIACFLDIKFTIYIILLFASIICIPSLFYSKILSIGILYGIFITYIHGFAIYSWAPKFIYGNLNFTGKVSKIKPNNRYLIEIIQISDQYESIPGKGYKFILKSDTSLQEASIITGNAQLVPIFDRQSVLSTRLFFDKVIGFGKLDKVLLISNPENSLKYGMQSIIKQKFDIDSQNIILPILFGSVSEDSRFIEKCKKIGISHLFAISGLHFTIFSSIFFLVGRWFLAPALYLTGFRHNMIQIGQIFGLIGIMYYLCLASLSWSVLRSAISSTIIIVLFLLRRQINAKYATSLSLLVIITIWPHAILDIGFQLSFVSVLTLLYGGKFASFFVFIATLPYSLYAFGSASLQPFVGNLICGTFFSILLMPVIGLGTIFGFINPFPWVIAKLIHIFLYLVNLCSQILVYTMTHKLGVISVLLWSCGLGLWILIRNRMLTTSLCIVSLLLDFKKPENQILISYNRKDFGFYENRILWVNNLDTFSVYTWESILRPEITLKLDDRFMQKQNQYHFHGITLHLSSKGRFCSASKNGIPILTNWNIISGKKPFEVIEV